MNWDRLDLHLENLIPGIASLAIIWTKYGVPESLGQGNTAILLAAFIALAYLLGSLCNIAGRLLLDVVSEWVTRPPLLRVFAKRQLHSHDLPSRRALNEHYATAIRLSLTGDHQNLAKEVNKRRQTGRLCRSALVPVLILASYYPILHHSLLTHIAAYLALLLLYGYSEVAIFCEADHGRIEAESAGRNSDA